jgi:tRNA threonylcarbamoyladenosine biosynthesis protein TsaE
MIYKTNSIVETKKLAKDLAKKYQRGGILALSGPLGSGKTTFVQGFAKGLGIKQRLISPSFILMREYPLLKKSSGKLFHIDLYRLEKAKEIKNLGLEEIFQNPQNIVLIEWAEKLGKNLPQKTVYINFKIISENSREICLSNFIWPAVGEEFQKLKNQ